MERTKQSSFMVSPEFEAFFDTLLEVPVNIKMCFDSIGRAIAFLEKDIPIGRVDVKIYASANSMQPDGERIRTILYQKGKRREVHPFILLLKPMWEEELLLTFMHPLNIHTAKRRSGIWSLWQNSFLCLSAVQEWRLFLTEP